MIVYVAMTDCFNVSSPSFKVFKTLKAAKNDLKDFIKKYYDTTYRYKMPSHYKWYRNSGKLHFGFHANKTTLGWIIRRKIR